MKKLLLFIATLLPLTGFSQGKVYDGFYLEDNQIVWEGVYRSDLSPDDARDALIAQLGSTNGIQLSPVQPKDRIIGKAEIREGMKTMNALAGVNDVRYTFGFIATPTPDGYFVKVTDYTRNAGGYSIPMNKQFPTEKALARHLSGRVRQYTDLLWKVFKAEGATAIRGGE